MNEIVYEHITLDNSDVPVIQKIGTKVIELVLDHLTYGWRPEELHFLATLEEVEERRDIPLPRFSAS